MVIKMAKCDADSKSVEKVAKRLMRKKLSAEKYPKNGIILLLLICAKVFGLQLLLSEIFLHFFLRFRTQHRILYFVIPLSNSCQNFCLFILFKHFSILKPNTDEMAKKKEKHILKMCLRIPFYCTSIPGYTQWKG
jgi:hypothetical protein